MISGIYVRVSTEQQEATGTSLVTQEQRCREAAALAGHTISEAHVWREAASGSHLERPLLSEMRRAVRNGEVNVIWVYDADRLSRDPLDLVSVVTECGVHDVHLHFVIGVSDDSPQGKLVLYVQGYAGQQERLRLRERTMRGKFAVAAKGRMPIGDGVGLYGYHYDPFTKARTIRDSEAGIVRRIFREVAEGKTLFSIARDLNEQSIPTKTGKGKWQVTTIKQLLSHTAYYGTDHYGQEKSRKLPNGLRQRDKRPPGEWVTIEGYTPPIISKEAYDAARRQLEMHQMVRSDRNRQYILTGITRCGSCGGPVVGTSPDYYRCNRARNNALKQATCFESHIRKDRLEETVWTAFTDAVLHPEVLLDTVRSALDPADMNLPEQIQKVRQKIEAVERMQLDLVELQPELLENVFRKRVQSLTTLHHEHQENLQELEALHTQAVDISIVEDRLSKQCADLASEIVSMDTENRQKTLRVFGVAVRATRSEVEIDLEINRGIMTTSSPTRWRSPSRTTRAMQRL